MKVFRDYRWYIVAGLIMIAVAMSPGRWTSRAGLDFWNIPQLEAEIAACEEKSKRMDAENEALTVRIQIKDVLVKELIAGRVSLASVSDQFYTLNSDDPVVIDQLRRHFHIDDDRAVAALNVIAFADTYLDTEADAVRKPVIMKRLDDEFDRLFPQYESMQE
jgi:hypothetical protein